ncbi:MAG: hypothetical protein PUB14_09585 [Lachnospiraceae bacterium]|nr:hypothetical protein [Lachnospiraceae bacterium]
MADKIFPILLAYMAVASADAFILYGVDKYVDCFVKFLCFMIFFHGSSADLM